MLNPTYLKKFLIGFRKKIVITADLFSDSNGISIELLMDLIV